MTPFSLWEHRVARFEDDEWVIVDVELDLARAVTLVASASARLAPEVEYQNPPPYRFGYALTWLLQDTLTGQDWHRFAGGHLVSTDAAQIERISSPLGAKARLALKPVVLAAMDRSRHALYEDAVGWRHLWSEMGLERPTDLWIKVAVRSL